MATQVLDLFCSQCGGYVVRYRKEGTGSLVRLYVERIVAPKSLARLGKNARKADLDPLTCPDCGKTIGVPMVHEGKRPALRLIQGTFRRKKS